MKAILAILVLMASVVQAATQKIPAINVETEAARVRKQLQQIQGQSISREAKTQKQRDLLAREIAAVNISISGLQQEIADATKKGTDAKSSQESREAVAAAQQRRKAALANLQKLLDTLRSMNPQL